MDVWEDRKVPKFKALPCWNFNQQPSLYHYHSAMPVLTEVPWAEILAKHVQFSPISRAPAKLPQSPPS